MTDLQFLKQVNELENRLGFRSKKFSGAVVVEILRQVIESTGLTCSRPNSFICDVPIEVDLLIVSAQANPVLNLLYDPKEVIACLEVKKSGLIAEAASKVGSDFSRIATYCPQAKTFYVSLSEDQKKVTEIRNSDQNYIFFKRGKNGKLSSTGDFDRFVTMLAFLRSQSTTSGFQSLPEQSASAQS